MCKVGDIILIKNYVHNGQPLGRHSFVVISDEAGKIQGLDYDIICNVMSSFKDEDQRRKKLMFPGNFPITHDDTDIVNGNKEDGYIKAEQFYYFDKDKIDYVVIGSMNEEAVSILIEFIQNLEIDIEKIIDNL